jgi:Spy/CpxP family protein refolding chaperone
MSRLPVFARLFVLTLAVLLAADVCFAQDREGRGRRGGFGRGFDRSRMMSKTMLLGSSQVQTELKLSDEQKSQIDTISQEARENMFASFRGFGDIRDLPEEERNAKLAEAREKMQAAEKATNEKLAGVLDDAQEKRLNEIQLQAQGPSVFSNEEVAAKLNLTAEQKQKVKDLLDAQREVRDELVGGDNLSREERRAKFEENRAKLEELGKETESGIVDTLTDAQKQQWNEMKGSAFELDRSTLQFGRGFGGRGNRDRNN